MRTQRGAPEPILHGPSQQRRVGASRVSVYRNANCRARIRNDTDISGDSCGRHLGARPTRGPPAPAFHSEDRFAKKP
jgi:hypothetical protein